MISGMTKGLKEKLGWKDGQRVLLVGLPEGLVSPFAGVEHVEAALGAKVPKGRFELAVGFARDSGALAVLAPALLAASDEASKVWVCYPKLSAKMMKIKTDLTRDRGWEPMIQAGWIVVSIAAVDATWSAVRFRPKHLVKSLRG
jgi:hypothetical protein